MGTDRLPDQRSDRARRERGDAPVSFEPATGPTVPSGLASRRRLRHVAAASGTAALVAAAVAGVLFVVDHPTSRSPAAGGHPSARGAQTITTAAARQLAVHAPCRRTTADTHPATAVQVARFATVVAIGCRVDYRDYPGRGVWQVMERSVATRGLAALLAALRRPDGAGRGIGGPACPVRPGSAELPVLLADDHGTYLHPRLPSASCGGVPPAVTGAMAALRWQPVSTRPIAPVHTPPVVLRHCLGQLEVVGGRSVQVPHLPGLIDQRLRTCLIADPPNEGIRPYHHGPMPPPERPVVPPH